MGWDGSFVQGHSTIPPVETMAGPGSFHSDHPTPGIRASASISLCSNARQRTCSRWNQSVKLPLAGSLIDPADSGQGIHGPERDTRGVAGITRNPNAPRIQSPTDPPTARRVLSAGLRLTTGDCQSMRIPHGQDRSHPLTANCARSALAVLKRYAV